MGDPYILMLIALAILATVDLVVGVSNDAVNFLNSAIGSKAGDAATRNPAIELLLDLDSGKTVSIIQEEGDYSFATGQRVKIIKNKGKSRVMPLK